HVHALQLREARLGDGVADAQAMPQDDLLREGEPELAVHVDVDPLRVAPLRFDGRDSHVSEYPGGRGPCRGGKLFAEARNPLCYALFRTRVPRPDERSSRRL